MVGFRLGEAVGVGYDGTQSLKREVCVSLQVSDNRDFREPILTSLPKTPTLRDCHWRQSQ